MDRNEQHEHWSRLDKECLWHPFTPMKQWIAGEQTVIVTGEGFELIDDAGRRYIDGFSSLWCNLHGHRVPAIDAAIREQLSKIAHTTLLGFASPPSIELAGRLVAMVQELNDCGLRIADCGLNDKAKATNIAERQATGQSSCGLSSTPPSGIRNPKSEIRNQQSDNPQSSNPLSKVFFSDSGASAVEVALKMAYQYFQNIGQIWRRKFIALRDSYHGDTLGSVSVGGIDIFHKMFKPLLFEATFVGSPNAFYHPAGEQAGEAVLAQIDAVLSAAPGEYCAIIIEPLIQAAAGMLTHPKGFLAALRTLTARHGVLLIADEVASGFGRTGAMFACSREGVCPDLLCLGKGLTGGYLPVSATLASRAIFDSFCGEDAGTGYAGRTFFHGHTFSGNALGCAAANASIDLMHSSGLLGQLPAKIDLIRRRLAELANHPNVGDIRQCGMMIGIDIVAERSPRRFFPPARQVGAAICQRAMSRGIIIRPLGDVVVLMPAPAMDTATLERLLDGTIASIHEFFKETGV